MRSYRICFYHLLLFNLITVNKVLKYCFTAGAFCGIYAKSESVSGKMRQSEFHFVRCSDLNKLVFLEVVKIKSVLHILKICFKINRYFRAVKPYLVCKISRHKINPCHIVFILFRISYDPNKIVIAEFLHDPDKTVAILKSAKPGNISVL